MWEGSQEKATTGSYVDSPVGQRAPSTPANRVKQRMLEIGDTLTGNIRLVSLATVYCLPWTRTSGIVADLKVLALHREKRGTQAHNNADF